MSTKAPRLYLNDNLNLSEEFRELLPSLPTEKAWFETNFFHLYQGFWYFAKRLDGVLSARRSFKAMDSDIILATYPKSGTTWLQAIIFALFNRCRYSEPCDKPNHPLLQKNPHDLIPYLESLEDLNLDPSSFPSPRLFGTHMPFVSFPESLKDSKCKIVYVRRNPKDTFVSLWHFTNKLRSMETGNELGKSFEKFCKGVSTYGPYWNHVIDYYKASMEMPSRFMFLKYEDMMEKPGENLKMLAEFLGCPFSKDEEASGAPDEILRLCSFGSLIKVGANNRDGNKTTGAGTDTSFFFRKGQVGDWVNHLTPEMAERIDRITEEKFNPLGLKIEK